MELCGRCIPRDDDELVNYDDVYAQYAEDYANYTDDTSTDPKLSKNAIGSRWQQLGLSHDPSIREWADSVEWASLGCFCGPARALQMLGLRKKAYPLDFMRSDVFGVIHLLKNRFQDFFETRGSPVPGVVQGEYTISTEWGGSFWHHDIRDAKVRQSMQRRVDRLLGEDPEVPLGKPRAFVITLNGSAGVAHAHELHSALQEVYGKKNKVYLLTIIDNQDHEELDKLFYTKHKHVLFFKAPSYIWTNAGFEGLDTLAEAYTHGIARAIAIWTKHEDGATVIVPNLHELGDSVLPFYANSPATHLFNVIEGAPMVPGYLAAHWEDMQAAYEADDEEIERDQKLKCTIM